MIRKMILLLIAVMLLAPYQPGWARGNRVQPRRSTDVVVRLRPGASWDEFNRRHGTTLVEQIPQLGLARLSLPPSVDPADALPNLVSDIQVISVHEIFTKQAPEASQWIIWRGGGPGPSGYNSQYPLDLTGIITAQLTSTGAGITVAVLDTGTDLDHEALVGHFSSYMYDWIDNDAIPQDEPDGIDNDGDGQADDGTGHGTHVSGIVALTAPSAQIMPLRVLDTEGWGDDFTLAEAITAATDNGARVINLSLGSSAETQTIADAINYAASHNVLVVASAGNDSADEVQFPAALYRNNGERHPYTGNMISVCATDENDAKASFSNYNRRNLALCAPGVSIYSTMWDGTYAWWDGTSMAAPFISGVAALVMSANPSLTVSQVRQIIENTAVSIDGVGDNYDYQGELGHGRLNAVAAVNCALTLACLP